MPQVSFTIRSGGTHSAPASRIEKGHAPVEASGKQNSAVLSFRIRSGGAAQAKAMLQQDLDTATQEAPPAEQGQHLAEAPDISGLHQASLSLCFSAPYIHALIHMCMYSVNGKYASLRCHSAGKRRQL